MPCLLQPGFLIWLNTFAGPIIFNLACPVLIFWPLLSSAIMKLMVKREWQSEESWKGDFKLYDDATLLRKHLFRVSCGMIAIASVKVKVLLTMFSIIFNIKRTTLEELGTGDGLVSGNHSYSDDPGCSYYCHMKPYTACILCLMC